MDETDDTPTGDPVEVAAAWIQARALVDRKNRRRLVWVAALAFIAALAVTLPASYILNGYLGDQAHDNALSNCEVQAAGRPIGNGRAFVQRQVLRIADDAFRQFPPRFQAAENAIINRELHRVLSQLPADGPKRVAGFGDLGVFLGYLPLIDCTKTITG